MPLGLFEWLSSGVRFEPAVMFHRHREAVLLQSHLSSGCVGMLRHPLHHKPPSTVTLLFQDLQNLNHIRIESYSWFHLGFIVFAWFTVTFLYFYFTQHLKRHAFQGNSTDFTHWFLNLFKKLSVVSLTVCFSAMLKWLSPILFLIWISCNPTTSRKCNTEWLESPFKSELK